MPKNRRQVFAQVEGQITDLHVQHGDQVMAGQLLLEMDSSELRIKQSDVEGRIELARKQIQALDNRRLSLSTNQRTAEQIEREDLEHASLLNQLNSFENEKKIYDEEIQRLQVTSAIDGRVITNNLQKLLSGRPVHPGQVLMEVADTQGLWIIEVDLPDRRIGHILRARAEAETH